MNKNIIFGTILALCLIAGMAGAGYVKTNTLQDSNGNVVIDLDSGRIHNVSEINKVYYVKPNNGTDIQAKLDLVANSGGTVIINHIGNYYVNDTINVTVGSKLDMMKGTWIKPLRNIDVIRIDIGYYTTVVDRLMDAGSLGDVYVNVTGVSSFDSSVVLIHPYSNWTSYWGGKIGLIKAVGGNAGNGSVFHYKSQGYSSAAAFMHVESIDASGFATVIYIEGSNWGYFNGNHFGHINADYVKQIIKARGNGDIARNDFGYIVYQDRRNTSANALIELGNAGGNWLRGMFWDMEGDEYIFNLTNSSLNRIEFAGSGPMCKGKCGRNDLMFLGNSAGIVTNYGNLTWYYKNSTVQAKKLVSDTNVDATANITATKYLKGNATFLTTIRTLRIYDNLSVNTPLFVVRGDTDKIGIGISSPIDVLQLDLPNGVDFKGIVMTTLDTGFENPFTTSSFYGQTGANLIDNDLEVYIGDRSQNSGGVMIGGITDVGNDVPAVVLYGLLGANTITVPAIELRVGKKHDSAATAINLATTDKAVRINNHDGTNLMTTYANGDMNITGNYISAKNYTLYKAKNGSNYKCGVNNAGSWTCWT